MEVKKCEKEVSELTQQYNELYQTTVVSLEEKNDKNKFDSNSESEEENEFLQRLRANEYRLGGSLLPSWDSLVVKMRKTRIIEYESDNENEDENMKINDEYDGNENKNKDSNDVKDENEKERDETETETDIETETTPRPRKAKIPVDGPLLGPIVPPFTEGNASVTEKKEEETITMKDLVGILDAFYGRIEALRPRMERFAYRLNEKDPITKAPRYGQRTTVRVETILRTFRVLSLITNQHSSLEDDDDNDDDQGANSVDRRSLVEVLRIVVESQERRRAQRQREEEALRTSELTTELQAEEDRRHREAQRQREEQTRKQRELEELARRAEESRVAKQNARIARRKADKSFMDSVQKGEAGVKAQLVRLREGCCRSSIDIHTNIGTGTDPKTNKDLKVALTSLYIFFRQIVSHPDNERFRTVRRKHEGFHHDIGRHDGGVELLIAAGFKLIRLQIGSISNNNKNGDDDNEEEILFSAEPNIETDMDGWSSWFDNLKAALDVIEKDMRALGFVPPNTFSVCHF